GQVEKVEVLVVGGQPLPRVPDAELEPKRREERDPRFFRQGEREKENYRVDDDESDRGERPVIDRGVGVVGEDNEHGQRAQGSRSDERLFFAAGPTARAARKTPSGAQSGPGHIANRNVRQALRHSRTASGCQPACTLATPVPPSSSRP